MNQIQENYLSAKLIHEQTDMNSEEYYPTMDIMLEAEAQLLKWGKENIIKFLNENPTYQGHTAEVLGLWDKIGNPKVCDKLVELTLRLAA